MYDDEMEYYHPDLQDWLRLKNGFTVDQEFVLIFAYRSNLLTFVRTI